MNMEAYISSGILEAYVMNELSPKEMVQVRKLADQYPEIREEIDKIESTLERLVMDAAMTPPTFVKDQLIDAINSRSTTSKASGKQYSSSRMNYWRVAAVISLLISFSFIFLWYATDQQLGRANKTIISLESEQQRLASNLENTSQTLSIKEQQFASITSPETKLVELKGTSLTPDAQVTIYWNTSNQNVILTVNKLPELPQGSQYQLWYLLDGKPYDAGLLSSDQDTQSMNQVGRADAFAITIEPAGGSISPTLEKMVVLGTVG